MNLALFFLLLTPATSSPGQSVVSPVPAPAIVAVAATPGVPVVFGGSSWHKQAYDALAQFISNRTRMIQFATVGMIIALFIICRNRW